MRDKHAANSLSFFLFSFFGLFGASPALAPERYRFAMTHPDEGGQAALQESRSRIVITTHLDVMVIIKD